MNRRMPNGTYGGVRGWGREAPAYSITAQVGRKRTHLALVYGRVFARAGYA